MVEDLVRRHDTIPLQMQIFLFTPWMLTPTPSPSIQEIKYYSGQYIFKFFHSKDLEQIQIWLGGNIYKNNVHKNFLCAPKLSDTILSATIF